MYKSINTNNVTIPRRFPEPLFGALGDCKGGVMYPSVFGCFCGRTLNNAFVSKFILAKHTDIHCSSFKEASLKHSTRQTNVVQELKSDGETKGCAVESGPSYKFQVSSRLGLVDQEDETCPDMRMRRKPINGTWEGWK
jgi:hypothetical protein